MKKLSLLFLSMLALGIIFQACDNSKTYAEMLQDEKNAVSDYIKQNNIKTISVGEFEKDTVTNVAENEYVAFSNGVYMQIVKRGEGDTIKNREEVLVFFIEYDLMEADTTICSNVDNPYYSPYNLYPLSFFYTETSSSSYGTFLGDIGVIEVIGAMGYWGSSGAGYQVPAGWLYVLQYIKDGAHIKLIVPSKVGHSAAQQDVKPYFYDLREMKFMKYKEDKE